MKVHFFDEHFFYNGQSFCYGELYKMPFYKNLDYCFPGEEWRSVEIWDGFYEVSNWGRVKSINRWLDFIDGRRRYYKGKILSPATGKYGYLLVGLRKNNQCYTRKIHVLVAKYFIDNPEKKRTVNHKKGIKTDNRTISLEYMTYSENHKHAFRVLNRQHHKPLKGVNGILHHSSKPVAQISCVNGNIINVFGSGREASQKLGKSGIMINNCCKNPKRYKTGYGFKWRYVKREFYHLWHSPEFEIALGMLFCGGG